jgi:hypothetical protein
MVGIWQNDSTLYARNKPLSLHQSQSLLILGIRQKNLDGSAGFLK